MQEKLLLYIYLRLYNNNNGELIYPKLTEKKESNSTDKTDNTATGTSTADIKQEEYYQDVKGRTTDKEDFGSVRTVIVKDKVTGRKYKSSFNNKK